MNTLPGATSGTPGVHLHRAARADRLVDALAEVLATPLDDAFAIEQVAVPTHGIERWLSQRLADRLGATAGASDGVCSGVDFPSPGRLVRAALAAVDDLAGDADPWRPERAVWALLGIIDAHRDATWAEPLWAYLRDRPDTFAGGESGRRWSTARRLVELFDRYATYRPAMLEHWRAGRDTDAAGRPLRADRVWQAVLWRELRLALGVPGPAERLGAAVASLRADPERSDLPERISLFGLTRLDPRHGAVLAGLAAHRRVHLWLPHPSPSLWSAVAADLSAATDAENPVRLGPRSTDATLAAPRHRLLGYLGRDVRELQTCLAAACVDGLVDHPPADPLPDPNGVPTLLRLLQSDLAANAAPRDDQPVLAADDVSVAFHAAHGPDRQVEVLREVLVGLLADDPTLEPRDIIVMCPDIEAYAPLIAAAFGLEAVDAAGTIRPEHPGHRLRVRLADRSLREVNPLLATLGRLLALPASRMSAAELLDLLALPPVARRFGLVPDDLTRLTALVTSAGVRWGLDAGHRAPYGMADFGQNTWAAGLDRLLLGVAMDEAGQHFLGTALPLDDVDSSDVGRVGRLAEFVDRIRVCTDGFAHRQPLVDWVRRLRGALTDLTLVVGRDAWQLAHAHARLAALEADGPQPDDSGREVLLSRSEVVALLDEAFRGRPTRANFRTGSLTMCTLQPMRSIPHRVVCLLGVDDGTFPRRPETDGDDLLAATEWVGDRDARSEDRQLLLDALLAAEERLIVVYGGMDPQTGEDRPPAVPIGALLDALEATARTTDRRSVREHITVRHPLQPFDARNFAVGAGAGDLGHVGPLSFDRTSLLAARAARDVRRPAAVPFPAEPLDEPPAEPLVALADLRRFYKHPIKAMLKDRGGLTVGWADEQVDGIPVALDSLQSWKIGDRLLRAHLDGADLQRLAAAEWRRGDLPPRGFGRAEIDNVCEAVAEVAAAARPWLIGTRERRDISVELFDGTRVKGSVGDLHGTDLVRVSYSKLSAAQRLDAWLDLLALSCAEPAAGWRVVLVGRGAVRCLDAIPPGWTEPLLRDLVDLRRAGLQTPTPFEPRASEWYAQQRRGNRPFDKVARADLAKKWEWADESYRLYFPTVDALLAPDARPEERRADGHEATRFGCLARRVFDPMARLECEP